jgi:predicted AlkP superfamily phosphohydrolase/phosphomutase
VGARLLVIGLDGATLDLVRPWVAAGDLPVLGELMRRGAWGCLRSTVPPATFPAWTSLVTGVNPGRHGVLDFTERVPGTYRVRLLNGSYRRAPALWTRLSQAGRRVAVLLVPATYPPEPVAGVMVSGFDSPLATAIDGSFVHPPGLYREIRRLVGRLPFSDVQEFAIGPRWHETALARLLDGITRRTTVARALLAREPWDAFMVVYGASDTVAHHFWRFHDARSPRHRPSPFADAIRRVYRALDEAVGALLAATPESTVAIVSDHGSGGAGDRVVHLNRRLAEHGLLAFTPPARGRLVGLARAAALRGIPRRLQAPVVRRLPGAAGRLEGLHRFAGVDWGRTLAFSEELDYHPSVWLNLRGRDPEGVVEPSAYETTRARVAEALAGWRDDADLPVVRRVLRREDVYAGPYVASAPDLVLELAPVDGYSPSCLRSEGPGPALRRLDPSEHGAGRGRGMSGAHRPDGLVMLAGPGVRAAGEIGSSDIVDVLPTLLALVGSDVPEGLDGRPIAAALDCPVRLAADPVVPPAGVAPHRFGPAETRDLAARLAALGYLEPEA